MEERLTPEQLAEIKAASDTYVTDRLILVHMLMCFCMDIMNEVVERLKTQGQFRYGLKNTLKNVRREIKEMMGGFFGKIDPETTDEYIANYEVLDDALRVIVKLKDFDSEKLTKSREAQFTEYWYNELKKTTPPMIKDIIDWSDRN